MSNERIPICAVYLTDNAAPHVTRLIERLPHAPRENWERLLEQSFHDSSATLCPRRIQAILGHVGDPWTREAYSAAVDLCNRAIAAAVQNRRIWDRRRTARTRRELMVKLANDHIKKWCDDRGISLEEGGDA
jgi:hypothetical protein